MALPREIAQVLYRHINPLNHTVMKPVTHTHKLIPHQHTLLSKKQSNNYVLKQKKGERSTFGSRKNWVWISHTYSSTEHCSFPLPSTHQRLQQPTVKQFSPLPFGEVAGGGGGGGGGNTRYNPTLLPSVKTIALGMF